MVLSKMDLKADPCQDFFEYSCAAYVVDPMIPADSLQWSTFALMNQRTISLLRRVSQRVIVNILFKFNSTWIIIIIINIYSPVSNTRCHSIGHNLRIARIKMPGRQSREMGKSLGRESNFEEVCFEPGTEYW